MKHIIIPSIHILPLSPRGYTEAPDWPHLSIILTVRRRLPAPVRLEVSAADRLQAAPSRTRGQTVHVCASAPHCCSVSVEHSGLNWPTALPGRKPVNQPANIKPELTECMMSVLPPSSAAALLDLTVLFCGLKTTMVHRPV